MKIIKGIGNIFKFIFDMTHKGFYFICLLFSRGFYYWIYKILNFFRKRYKKCIWLHRMCRKFKIKQEQPEYFFVMAYGFLFVFAISYLVYGDTNKVVKLEDDISRKVVDKVEVKEDVVEENEKISNFKKYGNMSLSEVNFNELLQVNKDVVSWLSVDSTNINYPVVKTTNNDYYLNRSIDRSKTTDGWPFMDYRNNSDMSDRNTIFYGHNLLNKSAFGSVSNIFTNKWFSDSNHTIIVVSESKIFKYEIFSAYYSDPVNYYLQTSFSSDSSFGTFVGNLKNKSIVKFNTNVSGSDKIITLSTCTDDNKGRKVVHAKLVSVENR